MAINKVVYDSETLIDLTGDTVTADSLAEGVTAHAASGEPITGTLTAVQYGKSQSLNDSQKAQARTNIGAASSAELDRLSEAILVDVTTKTATNNLNDGVYEYGYLNSDGSNMDGLTPENAAFRTKNYIPVQGGKRLCHNSDAIRFIKLAEYNANKEILAYRDSEPSVNKWDTNKGVMLNADTKFVRFAVWETATDLTAIKINVFYPDNINEMWADPGDVFRFVPPFAEEDIGKFVPMVKVQSPLTGKKIVYDGDSIAESRLSYANNGGGYAKLIADAVGGVYVNQAVGGARLTTASDGATYHSVVDNLPNLPVDGDIYCFEGGINDYWTPKALGTYSKTDFTGTLDTNTICGALETIFRYALTNFVGKPICFVIVHKIQSTAYEENSNGDTFEDYRNAMVGICQKYSIPYYDAFSESGLNGWNTAQNEAYLTANTDGTGDGTHPNEEGYKRYYVPQLISLFESIMPVI